MMESLSNNWELTNLVLQLEEITKRTDCHGGEIFLFTDNAVAESVYNKGNSLSKRLFEGMLSIRKMAMTRDVRVHIVHVAGSQMIEQGTDGLSRGTHSQGVMRGMAMKAFIPLHLTALERSSSLEEWVESWWPERDGEHLQWHVDPADWFDRCHTKGNHVWAPPPAAADVVAEELGRAIHKRPNFWHLILVPRLFTARWARALGRECTVRLDIPPGSGAFWDSKQHEPLFLYVCAPLLPVAPGSIRQTPYVDNLRSLLRQLWPTAEWKARDCLRKFVNRTRDLATIPEGMVRQVLSSPNWKPLPNRAWNREKR